MTPITVIKMHLASFALGILVFAVAAINTAFCSSNIHENPTVAKDTSRGTSGIELMSEENLSSSDLQRIGRNIGVDLSGGANSIYSVGNSEVKVNYLIPDNEGDMDDLFIALFEAVGSANAILMDDDRVYEIKTDDPRAGVDIIATLDIPSIQIAKLNPFKIYGEATMASDEIITGSDLENVSGNLGVELDALINQTIDVNGESVRANFLSGGDGVSAEEIVASLASIKGSDYGLLTLGDVAVEIVTTDDDLEVVVERVLTIPPPPAHDNAIFWIRFSAIPISTGDYMKQNECSLEASDGTGFQGLLRIDPTLVAGNIFPFFSNNDMNSFEVSTTTRTEKIDDSITQYTLDGEITERNPETIDIFITAETGNPINVPPSDPGLYLAESEFWPVGSDRAEEALDNATEGLDLDTDRAMVSAIHDWARENIEYGGDIVGSRYGADQVFRQMRGRCWDHSDVFITLARTAGYPCRQIAGWVYGLGGHVWSQVWLEDEEVWLDIDTTAEGVGVACYYIPIWGTRDGDMRFLYTELPTIERLP
jgi:hypothetical protein